MNTRGFVYGNSCLKPMEPAKIKTKWYFICKGSVGKIVLGDLRVWNICFKIQHLKIDSWISIWTVAIIGRINNARFWFKKVSSYINRPRRTLGIWLANPHHALGKVIDEILTPQPSAFTTSALKQALMFAYRWWNFVNSNSLESSMEVDHALCVSPKIRMK